MSKSRPSLGPASPPPAPVAPPASRLLKASLVGEPGEAGLTRDVPLAAHATIGKLRAAVAAAYPGLDASARPADSFSLNVLFPGAGLGRLIEIEIGEDSDVEALK